MGFFTMIMAGAALSFSLILTAKHVLPGNGKYLFGNATAVAAGLELAVLINTIISAGTISALLVNSISGIFIGALLYIGAAVYGGTKLSFSMKDIKNGSYGFTSTEVAPTITVATLPALIVAGVVGFFSIVSSIIVGIFNIVLPKVVSEEVVEALTEPTA